MGKVNMSGGGSHVNLKVITAQAGDIVEGKTGIDPKGKPLPGTLKLTGNMTAADLLPGKTGYSTNPKERIAGAMPTQGAKTITPGASAQKVAAGRYLTGDITVPGFVMPSADVIKKGAVVEIYGRKVTGKWEGYVAELTDLYYKGNNPSNFRIEADGIGGTAGSFETTYIEFTSTTNNYNSIQLISGKSYNFAGYKKINIEFAAGTQAGGRVKFIKHGGEYLSEEDITESGVSIISFDLSKYQTTFTPRFDFAPRYRTIQVSRIWID